VYRRARVAFVIAILAPAAAPAYGQWTVRVDAPASLQPQADRLKAVDADALARALEHGGLSLPTTVSVTLIPDDDPRARATPDWYVGLASGTRDIAIFPGRVAAYPYDSLESVFRHEVVHLALNARAGGRPLPRWFHEGIAVAIESGWGVADRLRLVAAAFSEPRLDDLSRLFRSDARSETMQAYLLAAALVDELRRSHGAALPGRIAARVAAGEPFDAAFASETGESPPQAAARAWRSYRRWTNWMPYATSASAVWSLILALAFVAFGVRLWQRRERRRRWPDDEDDDDFGS
jgi:hypothetical protein